MKLSTPLLIVSLLANVGLLAALAFHFPGEPATSRTPSRNDSPTSPTISASAAASRAAVAPAMTNPSRWAHLRPDNLDELAGQLRAAGFSPQEVRTMLNAVIRDRTIARRKALVGRQEETPYWRSPAQSNRLAQAHQEELAQIYREQRDLEYRYVNGPDALADNEDLLVAAQRRFGVLPLQTLQRLTVLQHDFDEQRNELYARSGATPDAATRKVNLEAINALERTQLNAAAELLTPDQLEQYQLRNHSSGLRQSLANFRPTEEEFKSIYRLQGGKSGFSSSASAQLAAGMGTERYAEFTLLQTSDGSGKLGQLMSRLELPLTTINTLNAVRDDVQVRAATVAGDKTLSPTERQAQFASLAREAQDTLTAALGARGYEAYVDMKGDWLRALQPKQLVPTRQ